VLKTQTGEKPTVALTLDACSGGFDARILDALIAWRVPATIFMTGVWIRHNGSGLARILSEPSLFAIGNHGARHIPAVLGGRSVFGLRGAGDLAAVRDEVVEGEDVIRAATGARPFWYRGATALYSSEALPTIEATGVSVAGFSLNADMGASLPAESVAARIRMARDGDVIIAHVNQPFRPSGAGVVAGVRHLLDQGTRFVRLEADTPAVASL
jgi:peptidoglycan/xylan/chitin deacetylase (PgdA/CDA1 family)